MLKSQFYCVCFLKRLFPSSQFLFIQQQCLLFSNEAKFEKLDENVLLKSLSKYTPGFFYKINKILIINF